jgi:hypothetical protein
MAFSSITNTAAYTFIGATSGTVGVGGLIPAPNAGDQKKFLRGDGLWSFPSGAVGGGNDAIFFENDATMRNDYTISSGRNAMSAGPITIESGVTLTIPNNSVYTIV